MIKVGDRVYITILKNGYWKGQKKGTVLKVNEKTNRATVSSTGENKSYSLNNLCPIRSAE